MRNRQYKPKIPRCNQCQNAFSHTVQPMLLCKNCLEVKCKKCISELRPNEDNRINCPFCFTEIQHESLTVDMQTKQVVEIIEEIKKDLEQRYKFQLETLKENIKLCRESFKQRQLEFKQKMSKITAQCEERLKQTENQTKLYKDQLQRESLQSKEIMVQNDNLKQKVKIYYISEEQWKKQRQLVTEQKIQLQNKLLASKIQFQYLSNNIYFWEDDKRELAKIRKELQEQKTKYQELRQKTLKNNKKDYQNIKIELENKTKCRQCSIALCESSKINDLYSSKGESQSSSKLSNIFIKNQNKVDQRVLMLENNYTVENEQPISFQEQLNNKKDHQNIFEQKLDISVITPLVPDSQGKGPINKQIRNQRFEKNLQNEDKEPVNRNQKDQSLSHILSELGVNKVKNEQAALNNQQNIISRSSYGSKSEQNSSQKSDEFLKIKKTQGSKVKVEQLQQNKIKKEKEQYSKKYRDSLQQHKHQITQGFKYSVQQNNWDRVQTEIDFRNSQQYPPSQLYHSQPSRQSFNKSSHQNSMYALNYRQQDQVKYPEQVLKNGNYAEFQQISQRKQTFYRQDIALIDQILEQYNYSSALRKQSESDSVVHFLQQLDYGHYLSHQERFLIATLQKKKAQAQKKQQLIIRVKANHQVVKYKHFQAQIFAYTMQSIKYVDLSYIQLDKIIDIKELSNLKRLNLSCNYLRQIKVLKENTKLQILNLQKNCLESLDGICNLTLMTELYIMENKLNLDCYKYLKVCHLTKLTKISVGSSLNDANVNDKCLFQLLERNYFTNLYQLKLNPQHFSSIKRIIDEFNKVYRNNHGYHLKIRK